MKVVILSVVMMLAIWGPTTSHAVKVLAHSTIINQQGDTIGEALYRQGRHGLLIEIQVAGLPPGMHGMHFHAVGVCNDTFNFKHSGGHIMTEGKPHGYLHMQGPHEGNLPNLIVHADGTAHVELYTELVSLHGHNGSLQLLDDDRSALVIHRDPDDHHSQPIGNSGPRIACGVVNSMAPPPPIR